MSKISNNEIKKKAVLIEPAINETGHIYLSGDGRYKNYDGRKHIFVGDSGVVLLYENAAAFPATGIAGNIYRERVTGYLWLWDGRHYFKIGDTKDSFLNLGNVGATFDVDFDEAEHFAAILTEDATMSLVNPHVGTRYINITGAFSLTTTPPITGDAYSGTENNHLTIRYSSPGHVIIINTIY